jgi:hypothetical protein
MPLFAEAPMNDIRTHNPYEPNTDLLRIAGWSVISTHGPYCTAWKGSQEIVLIWRNGHWEKVLSQGMKAFSIEAIAS